MSFLNKAALLRAFSPKAGRILSFSSPTSTAISPKVASFFLRTVSSSTVGPANSANACLRSPTSSDADALLQIMGGRDGSVATDDETLERYNVDWTGKYIGRSKLLVKPNSTDEVSRILSYCNMQRIGIVPQAGNTGLVGGSTPIGDEVILTVEGMKEVHSFDSDNGIMTCDAGCITQSLHDYANERDHLLPIDLGSKGSCMIGGNVSTNAGGQYYYRFGSLHANILGLEVVLANGTVLDLMNQNRKDNTGFDMKHLFIGAEGTLGVVTKVAIACPRLPKARNAAFLALGSFDDVRRTLALAKNELGETLSAFEFMDWEVMKLIAEHKSVPVPMEAGAGCGFFLLVETQGSNNGHDLEKMESFLEKAMDMEWVVDGTLAQDFSQVNEMWELREACNPLVKDCGANYKYDLSIPIADFEDIMKEMRERLKVRPDAVVLNWGHVIDGNLHFNVATPGLFEKDSELEALIEPYVFETVVKRGGSISAEHGLGRCKHKYLGSLAKDPVALSAMRSLKQMFDPNQILNPGKYLPTSQGSGTAS